MPARNPMLPGASSDNFAPPPTVFAAEGAKPQQSFPLALLGSGRCASCASSRAPPAQKRALHTAVNVKGSITCASFMSIGTGPTYA